MQLTTLNSDVIPHNEIGGGEAGQTPDRAE